MIVGARGGTPKWIRGELNGPRWSRDGREFVYAAEDRSVQQSFIFTSRTDGSGTKQLTAQEPGQERHSDAWPAWSPNGEEIAFRRAYSMHSSIVIMKRDGTGLRVVLPNRYVHYLNW